MFTNNIATHLSTKGWLAGPQGIATRGQIVDEAPTIFIYVDIPPEHKICCNHKPIRVVAKGWNGDPLAVVTRGNITVCRPPGVFAEYVPPVIPPVIPPTGPAFGPSMPGGGGLGKSWKSPKEKEKQYIKITMTCGNKTYTETKEVIEGIRAKIRNIFIEWRKTTSGIKVIVSEVKRGDN